MKYNVKMLRDFLTHLKWSLIVEHFELTAGPEAYNPELAEKLGYHFSKSGVLRLLGLLTLKADRPDLSEADIQEALKRLSAGMAEIRAEQLRHLEALEELFEEAFAHTHNRMFNIVVPASKVLDGSFFGNTKAKKD